MNIVTKQFQDSLQKVGAQLTSPEAKKQVRDLYSKIETKETTSTGGGSGSYEGPLSGPKMSMWADEAPKKIQAKGGPVEEEKELDEKWSEKYKKSIDCNNPKGFSQKAHCQGRKKHMKEEDTEIEKGEFKEATGASSAGQYSGPMFLAKDSKNWRGGKKPIYKGGKFVRVKKKCKNFPYCNQGDIKALKIWEDDDLTEAIKNVAKTKNIHENIVRAILLHEIEETIFKD
jgi:hypothetical protein